MTHHQLARHGVRLQIARTEGSAGMPPMAPDAPAIRVRVEIMRPGKYENVGKSR
jgi:hypothetical protein